MGQNVGQDRLIYEKKPLSKGSTNTMAETVGFEPTDAFTRQLISNQSRYNHFDTSPFFPSSIITDSKEKIQFLLKTLVIKRSLHGLMMKIPMTIAVSI